MDDADRAQEVEDCFLAATLARPTRPAGAGAGASDCESCGEEIPAARRAVIETRFCVGCQSVLERMSRR